MYTMRKGQKIRYAEDWDQKRIQEQQGYVCIQEPNVHKAHGTTVKPVENKPLNNKISESQEDEKTVTTWMNPRVETTEEVIRGTQEEEQKATKTPKRRRN